MHFGRQTQEKTSLSFLSTKVPTHTNPEPPSPSDPPRRIFIHVQKRLPSIPRGVHFARESLLLLYKSRRSERTLRLIKTVGSNPNSHRRSRMPFNLTRSARRCSLLKPKHRVRLEHGNIRPTGTNALRAFSDRTAKRRPEPDERRTAKCFLGIVCVWNMGTLRRSGANALRAFSIPRQKGARRPTDGSCEK